MGKETPSDAELAKELEANTFKYTKDLDFSDEDIKKDPKKYIERFIKLHKEAAKFASEKVMAFPELVRQIEADMIVSVQEMCVQAAESRLAEADKLNESGGDEKKIKSLVDESFEFIKMTTMRSRQEEVKERLQKVKQKIAGYFPDRAEELEEEGTDEKHAHMFNDADWDIYLHEHGAEKTAHQMARVAYMLSGSKRKEDIEWKEHLVKRAHELKPQMAFDEGPHEGPAEITRAPVPDSEKKPEEAPAAATRVTISIDVELEDLFKNNKLLSEDKLNEAIYLMKVPGSSREELSRMTKAAAQYINNLAGRLDFVLNSAKKEGRLEEVKEKLVRRIADIDKKLGVREKTEFSLELRNKVDDKKQPLDPDNDKEKEYFFMEKLSGLLGDLQKNIEQAGK